MNKTHDIPEEFYSFETGKPFERCSCCEKELLKDDVEYSISKIVRQYGGYSANDVIAEFVICFDCGFQAIESISKKSLEVLQVHNLRVMLQVDKQYEVAMSKCVFSKKPVSSLQCFQVVGFFKGNKLSADRYPYLIDVAEVEEMESELSEATKDFFEDFTQQIIGPTPEWIKENIPGGRLVLI